MTANLNQDFTSGLVRDVPLSEDFTTLGASTGGGGLSLAMISVFLAEGAAAFDAVGTLKVQTKGPFGWSDVAFVDGDGVTQTEVTVDSTLYTTTLDSGTKELKLLIPNCVESAVRVVFDWTSGGVDDTVSLALSMKEG